MKTATQDMGPHHILDTAEAIEYLRISRSTLMRLIYAGKIRFYKVGQHYRFRKHYLDQYIQSLEECSMADPF